MRWCFCLCVLVSLLLGDAGGKPEHSPWPLEYVCCAGVALSNVSHFFFLSFQSGRWVVLEDIDKASFEVLSALIPLLQYRVVPATGKAGVSWGSAVCVSRRCPLLAGGQSSFTAAAGFQLFVTRTTSQFGSAVKVWWWRPAVLV